MAQAMDYECYCKLRDYFAKHKYYFRLSPDKTAPMYQIVEKPTRGTMPEIIFNLNIMRNGDFNRCLEEVKAKIGIKGKATSK